MHFLYRKISDEEAHFRQRLFIQNVKVLFLIQTSRQPEKLEIEEAKLEIAKIRPTTLHK